MRKRKDEVPRQRTHLCGGKEPDLGEEEKKFMGVEARVWKDLWKQRSDLGSHNSLCFHGKVKDKPEVTDTAQPVCVAETEEESCNEI